MALLIDQYTLSQDATFKNRVQVAMLVAASSVLSSSSSPSGQVAVAQRIVDEPTAFVGDVAGLAVLNAAVAATAPTGTSATDAQIQAAVNAALLQMVR